MVEEGPRPYTIKRLTCFLKNLRHGFATYSLFCWRHRKNVFKCASKYGANSPSWNMPDCNAMYSVQYYNVLIDVYGPNFDVFLLAYFLVWLVHGGMVPLFANFPRNLANAPPSWIIPHLLCLRNVRAFPLLPAALASVSFRFVLVRVRVRYGPAAWCVCSLTFVAVYGSTGSKQCQAKRASRAPPPVYSRTHFLVTIVAHCDWVIVT